MTPDTQPSFPVPEKGLLAQLGIDAVTFKKHRRKFAAGADWSRQPSGNHWTETAAEKLRILILGEKPAADLPAASVAEQVVLTVAYVPAQRRPRVFCVGAGANPRDRTCWLPVAVRADRIGLFLRGMKIRAAKTDDSATWRFLGAPGETRVRYPRRKGTW